MEIIDALLYLAQGAVVAIAVVSVVMILKYSEK